MCCKVHILLKFPWKLDAAFQAAATPLRRWSQGTHETASAIWHALQLLELINNIKRMYNIVQCDNKEYVYAYKYKI